MRNNVTRIRARPASAAAAAASTACEVIDALEDVEALVTTTMSALGAEGNSPEAITLGFALDRLRAALAGVGGAPATQD